MGTDSQLWLIDWDVRVKGRRRNSGWVKRKELLLEVSPIFSWWSLRVPLLLRASLAVSSTTLSMQAWLNIMMADTLAANYSCLNVISCGKQE